MGAGGFHRFGRPTRPKSIPSSSIASCVASMFTAIASGVRWGSLNRPSSSRL
jgi:hypothetical protein